ncbi:MAG: hypothetical protein DRJ05_04775 [Bacteroidetes bacterium]|nr:MAG: hypothetical protein DRJ05_04775 [Bacteroidota bacterium]
MKMKFLLLFSILAFSPFLWSQETIDCYPATGNYNTGSTDGTAFTQTSLIKTAAGLVEAGWARFDISSVPANAPIQSVELNIYVAVDNNAYWQVMSIEEDPILGTPESVFTDCTNGDIYSLFQGPDFPEPDWYITDLGSEAVATLQDQVADGWFGISMWEFEPPGIYAIECEGWNETNSPYIVVTYATPGSPFPPFDPDPVNEAFAVDIDADVIWMFGANTDNYDLFFGTDNPPATMVVDNAIAATSGTYDPGTMDFNTTYYWQVIAKNTVDEVSGPIWSFNTSCGESPMPIFENFDSAIPPELPFCWNGLVNSTSQYSFVQTLGYNGIENSYCGGFENSDAISPTLILISPQLEGGAAGKYINFFAYGYAETMSVGTMTDPSDETTYNEIATIALTTNFQYEEYEVFFTNYTGDDNYIALKLITDGAYQGSYVDNILIDIAPTCPKPTGLYTAETTLNSATVGWIEKGDATQ